jgi:pimeloyl-ACP methyl ester carboxylesterase
MLRNRGDVGYYPDSFFVDLTDEDAGLTHSPRSWTESLTALLSTLTAVSSDDSLQSECFIPARFEKGSLTLRLYGHTGAGAVAPLTSTLIVEPGPLSAAYPAEMLTVGSRAVEIVRMTPGNTEGHAPGVLLVHGEGEHARRHLSTARALHERGYAVVAVSLPGYGLSAGPADLGGPATVAALEAAYQALAKTPGLDGAKLAIWGMGRGATAAALVAGRHPELSALLLQSGTYDLPAAYRAADAPARRD